MLKIDSSEITLDFLKKVGKEPFIISHENEDFYFKINLKLSTDKLVIHNNGAVDFSVKRPPVFQRSTWGKNINATSIFVDDRTIHNTGDDKFATGWLLGSKDRYFALDYSFIIKKIQKEMMIENRNVYYWGSSAGGTASIILATLHKGSTAIANNPQTNLLKSSKRNAILRNVFPNMSESDVLREYGDRILIHELMKQENYTPRLFYIQNKAHLPDMDKHANPFMQELYNSELDVEKVTFWFYHDKVRGHAPLITDKTLEYLNTIINYHHL